jgi:hypothetical protein
VCAVTDQVAKAYRRRCWWADFADLKQEGEVAALLAERSYDPVWGVSWKTYVRRAAQRWISGYLWHESSPVSGRGRRELEGLHRAPLDEELVEEFPSPELEATRAQWRAAVRKRLEEVAHRNAVAEFGIKVLMSDKPAREWAKEEGLPCEAVYACTHEARVLIANDPVLRALLEEAE